MANQSRFALSLLINHINSIAMQHDYSYYFILALCVLGSVTANAQEEPFPWPEEELGEAVMIPAGPPGTIDQTINGDTLDNGERAHNVYILERDATYVCVGRINNVGYPLMVMAEEGDGALPIIRAQGPVPGEREAPRAFHAQGDLYLKDLHIISRDASRVPTDNATIRLAADSLTVVNRGVILDYNRQNPIRINGNGCSVYVENGIIGPQGNSNNIEQGYALNYRDQFAETVHFRNTTFFSLTKGIMDNFGTARHGTLIIEHCTLVNSGIDGGEFGRPDSLVFQDNLLINTGILGDGYAGNREDFAEPLFAYALDSNVVVTDTVITGTDTTVSFEYVPPAVTFERNHFYNRPIIAATLPDTSTSYMAGDILIDEELSDDMTGGDNVMAQEDFQFTNFPMDDQQFVSFITDYYDVELDQAELPGYSLDPTSIDLTYSADHPAATAGRGGQPVGDLTWWGLNIITRIYDIKPLDVGISPNPTAGRLNISLENLQSVLVYDMNGRLVKLYNDLRTDTFQADVADMAPGTYIVVAINDDRQGVSRKIIKQ